MRPEKQKAIKLDPKTDIRLSSETPFNIITQEKLNQKEAAFAHLQAQRRQNVEQIFKEKGGIIFADITMGIRRHEKRQS